MTDSSKQPGMVYLVGAGPGHPGLITRWGYELLQQCDAVAYDALIPMELISELPQKIERYYVGKRAGRHSLPQSQINELLVTLARRGLKVVRLKGGDPFIYGRSGEEAEYLAAAGIHVILIPGVTAASAAAALSGFSLTNRQSASWVFLATGHGAETAGTPVPWNMVGALPGGTIVVYMGLAKLDNVVAELLSSGLNPEMPAIAVQAASTGLQRCVEAPLIKISAECKRQNLKPPALVIIGGAVRNRAKEIVAYTKPLAGKNVLVTSRSRIMQRLCPLLREAGAEPIPYPTVVLAPANDIEGWEAFLKLADQEGMCLLPAEEEVDYFIDGLLSRGMDLRSLSRFKIIAMGQSVESVLLARGIKADHTLQSLAPSSFAEEVPKLFRDSSLPLVLVRTNFGEDLLELNLKEQHSRLISLTVCLVSTAVWDAHWKDQLIENPPDFILFTGKAEVDGFIKLLGTEAAHQLALKSCVTAMNESVVQALSGHGLPIGLQANTDNADSLVTALIRYSQKPEAELNP
jgi:uroporphyrinogen III methyltransferase/synthase